MESVHLSEPIIIVASEVEFVKSPSIPSEVCTVIMHTCSCAVTQH